MNPMDQTIINKYEKRKKRNKPSKTKLYQTNIKPTWNLFKPFKTNKQL